MSDPVPVIPSRRGRAVAAYSVLAISSGLAAYIVIAGQPDNPLHAAALHWAFGVQITILVGQALSPISELVGLISALRGKS